MIFKFRFGIFGQNFDIDPKNPRLNILQLWTDPLHSVNLFLMYKLVSTNWQVLYGPNIYIYI